MAAAAPAKAPGSLAALPQSADDDKCYTFSGTVSFATPQEANIVCRALEVDPELRPEAVSKQLSVSGCDLVINFAATELRMLRGAVGNFYDMLALATRTLEVFGPAIQRP